jgi:hypothetical protein
MVEQHGLKIFMGCIINFKWILWIVHDNILQFLMNFVNNLTILTNWQWILWTSWPHILTTYGVHGLLIYLQSSHSASICHCTLNGILCLN